MSKILLPLFSTLTFMVSGLIFQCFIHFEFILVYGEVGALVSFFFFCMYQSSSPNTIIEETIFTPLYAHAPVVKY